MLYELEREQPIEAPIAQVWDFFSDPRNLNDLAAPDLQFRIVTQNLGKMFNGQIIEYRIKIAPILWRSWVTEIKNVVERVSFVDEQRFGPYEFWYHRHSFIDHGDHVLVGDHVVYALPGGGLWDGSSTPSS